MYPLERMDLNIIPQKSDLREVYGTFAGHTGQNSTIQIKLSYRKSVQPSC